MKEMIQVLPFPKVHPIWEHEWSVYPDIVRVPMSDGQVLNYYRVVEQPAPILGKALDHFNETCEIGYKAKEPRRKRVDRRKEEELE